MSQVFGMLSGSPRILLTVDSFHGPPVSWARQIHLCQRRSSTFVNPEAQSPELEAMWRKWAYNEELLRVVHGLYIIDAELASILHHEPIQNFESYCLDFTSSEAAFAAPSAADWQEKYLLDMRHRDGQPSNVDYRRLIEEPKIIHRIPATSLFAAYAALQFISTKVLSTRLPLVGTINSVRQYDQALIEFHQRFLSATQRDPKADPLQLNVLWHTVFMETLTDFNLLERAIGRDGCKLTAPELSNVTAWASSEDAIRCIFHGLMILKHIQAMNITSEPAIHVPRALFWAAVAILCHLRFGTMENGPRLSLREASRYPEFLSVDMDESILGLELRHSRAGSATALKTKLFSIIDILEHAGHWEIARKFAATLTVVSNFAFDCI